MGIVADDDDPFKASINCLWYKGVAADDGSPGA